MKEIRAVCVLLLYCGAGPAFPHNYLPAVPGQPVTPIEDIGASRAAYRTLTFDGQVDVYGFSARKGQEILIQMTVPLLERQRGFFPAFLLVYTGGGKAEFLDPLLRKGRIADPPHEALDRVHPHEGKEGPPAIGVEYDGSEPVVFDEIFTGTRYWTRQTLTVAAPADGTYRIGVYAPGGGTGKYVLAPGRREAFGIGDVFGLPAVRWLVREFCEEPLWPDAVLWGALAAAAALGIAFGAYALLAR